MSHIWQVLCIFTQHHVLSLCISIFLSLLKCMSVAFVYVIFCVVVHTTNRKSCVSHSCFLVDGIVDMWAIISHKSTSHNSLFMLSVIYSLCLFIPITSYHDSQSKVDATVASIDVPLLLQPSPLFVVLLFQKCWGREWRCCLSFIEKVIEGHTFKCPASWLLFFFCWEGWVGDNGCPIYSWLANFLTC
jgi:hypothetical protein